MNRMEQAAAPEFWKSSGFHLVNQLDDGWLQVSDDFMRAYYTRPEIHPIEESCATEHMLFERLMASPFADVSEEELNSIVDKDARSGYKIVLDYRKYLETSGSLEAAYAGLFGQGQAITIPPMFIDQLTHIIMRNVMEGTTDPMQLRAAEIFFRDQKVTTDGGQLMFADSEIIEMRRQDGGLGSLGTLIAESGTPLKEVSLDVMNDENASIYWGRSDQFDTAIDFRFTEPANDAFARVVEKFIRHFFKTDVRVQPLQNIKDTAWRWHIGLDATATTYLNGLYDGKIEFDPDTTRLAGLFSMTFLDTSVVDANLGGKPIYLGLAIDANNEIKMKPQNLLTNLPVRR